MVLLERTKLEIPPAMSGILATIAQRRGNINIRNMITLIILGTTTTSCYTLGRQEFFNFSATYFMDGTCEIKLPNRNGVFVVTGKFYNEDAYTNEYGILCREEIGAGVGIIAPGARMAITLPQDIHYTDENHVQLSHRFLTPWQIILDADHYRFIQLDNEIHLETRDGWNPGSGLNKYFEINEDIKENYVARFEFKFLWRHAEFGPQLPGFFRPHGSAGKFKSFNLSLRINSKKQAAKSGIYAKVIGESATATPAAQK